jgi:hypothetical protein
VFEFMIVCRQMERYFPVSVPSAQVRMRMAPSLMCHAKSWAGRMNLIKL